MYLHARWYDPTIGRFLSADDRLGRLAMPQDQNRYAYVVNNPLAYTDPTGHDVDWGAVFHWIAVALLVVAIAIAVVMTAGVALGVIAPLVAVKFAAGMITAGVVGGLIGGGINAGIAAATGGDVVGAFGQGFLEGFAWGVGLFGLGWAGSALRGGRAFLRPPQGPVAQTGSKAAMAGDDAVKAASHVTDDVGQSVTNPNEVTVMSRLRSTGSKVVHEPYGSAGPDFLAVGGRYRGFVEVAGRAGRDELHQLHRLASLRHLTGQPASFFVRSATQEFLNVAREGYKIPVFFF